MKVLGIMGSSRRDGNTNDLLDVALAGAADAGAEAEKLVLLDYTINHILNCADCAKRGACVHDDDFRAFMDKVLAADAHIWASPVYWFSVSGLSKVALDRWSCLLYWYPDDDLLARMKGKGAALISIQEEMRLGVAGAEAMIGCFEKTFEYCEQVYYGYLLAAGGSRGTVLNDPESVKQARELGTRVATSAGGVALSYPFPR